MTNRTLKALAAALVASTVQFGALGFAFADTTLLNVSYDPTRELYKDFNEAFAAKWKADTGETVTIQQSHGGSGKQARAVIDGLEADVVTLALESDINAIAEKSGQDRRRTGAASSPTIHRPTPRRSSSSCARAIPRASRTGATWSRTASRSSRRTRRPRAARAGTISPPGPGPTRQFGGDEAKIKDFVAELYAHVPVLDTGARGSTVTFAQREHRRRAAGLGERGLSRARGIRRRQVRHRLPADLDPGRAAGRRRRRQCRRQGHPQGGRSLSQLSLFGRRPEASPPSTTIARPSRSWCRPTSCRSFPEIKLVTIDDPLFGGWAKAQPTTSATAASSTRSTSRPVR